MKLNFAIFSCCICAIFVLSSFFPYKKLKTFKDKEESVAIKLPKNWHMKFIDHGKSSNMYISAEEMINKGDVYQTGVSIFSYANISKSFKMIKNDDDIIKLWYKAVKNASQKHYLNEEIEFRNITIGNYKGIISESIWQLSDKAEVKHVYHAILAYDDNLYTISLEAPVADWETYKEVYETALVTLELK